MLNETILVHIKIIHRAVCLLFILVDSCWFCDFQRIAEIYIAHSNINIK